MLGGNKFNPAFPVLTDDRYQYQNHGLPQLQLFGSVPAACGGGVDPVNFFSNDGFTPMVRTSKRVREAEDIPRDQKPKISLNYNNQFDLTAANVAALNPVSTGLRLSYDEDEHNSSVTSASGSITATPSLLFSLDDNIRNELERQNEEFDQYIKIQQEAMVRGVRDIKERQTKTFLATLEKGIAYKLREKDTEIENTNRRNKELSDRIHQVSTEVQKWQYRAKYSESVANALKTNLQAVAMGATDQGKEGFGDSEVDDAASGINNNLNNNSHGGKVKEQDIVCRGCKVKKEVSVLLMPCRHLCLCKDCDGSVTVCPVCRVMVTGFFPIHLS